MRSASRWHFAAASRGPCSWSPPPGSPPTRRLGYQPSINAWGPVLAFYTLATVLPPRRAALGALLVGGVQEYAVVAAHVVSIWTATGQTLVVMGLAWAFGTNVRRVRDRNDRLTELTRRLQVEQAARARHAVTEERLRIARELHDVVAHHLSVISIQSGLARYVFDSAPPTPPAPPWTPSPTPPTGRWRRCADSCRCCASRPMAATPPGRPRARPARAWPNCRS
ncbi:hypothetical protein GCM10020000_16930 [Streptomyces olivoverticillatus]